MIDLEVTHMNIKNYKQYITSETMMGPNSVRVLEELLSKYPLQLSQNDELLDLGCGMGITSLVLAKETAARVYANDLWIGAEDNAKRFEQWGVGERITPVHADANDLPFEERKFSALYSVDAYHYFAGNKGFFEQKILPFIKDGGTVLIGIPGIKDEFGGRSEELLADWLAEDTYMFKSPREWKEIIGCNERIQTVQTWEMGCFDSAWSDWLALENDMSKTDAPYFDSIIKPYTCFVGIYIKLKPTS